MSDDHFILAMVLSSVGVGLLLSIGIALFDIARAIEKLARKCE